MSSGSVRPWVSDFEFFLSFSFFESVRFVKVVMWFCSMIWVRVWWLDWCWTVVFLFWLSLIYVCIWIVLRFWWLCDETGMVLNGWVYWFEYDRFCEYCCVWFENSVVFGCMVFDFCRFVKKFWCLGIFTCKLYFWGNCTFFGRDCVCSKLFSLMILL